MRLMEHVGPLNLVLYRVLSLPAPPRNHFMEPIFTSTTQHNMPWALYVCGYELSLCFRRL